MSTLAVHALGAAAIAIARATAPSIPAPTNRADLGGVPVRGLHRRHPMSAAASNFLVHAAGAAPSAMTKATAPSILPIDRFFESFLLPASPRSITELAMHMVKPG